MRNYTPKQIINNSTSNDISIIEASENINKWLNIINNENTNKEHFSLKAKSILACAELIVRRIKEHSNIS